MTLLQNSELKSRKKPKPINWKKLNKNEKFFFFSLARRVIKREARRFQKRYGKNVAGIGIGFRTKGRLRRIYEELVIRIDVREKWSKNKKLKAGEIPIPPYFSVYIREKGRRREIRIPTDINVRGSAQLQNRTYVEVSADGIKDRGSICCLLRDLQTQDLFLLSCKHVFGLMKRTPFCQGRKDVRIDLASPKDNFVAHIARNTDISETFPDQSIFSLDACIARVDKPESVSSRINGFRPTKIFNSSEPIIGEEIKIPAKTKLLTAKVMEISSFTDLFFKCNDISHRVRYKRIIKYRFIPSVDISRGGDSGSAVVWQSNLVGMHFALEKGEKGEKEGLAMFVQDIIQQSIFGRNLTLESNHRV